MVTLPRPGGDRSPIVITPAGDHSTKTEPQTAPPSAPGGLSGEVSPSPRKKLFTIDSIMGVDPHPCSTTITSSSLASPTKPVLDTSVTSPPASTSPKSTTKLPLPETPDHGRCSPPSPLTSDPGTERTPAENQDRKRKRDIFDQIPDPPPKIADLEKIKARELAAVPYAYGPYAAYLPGPAACGYGGIPGVGIPVRPSEVYPGLTGLTPGGIPTTAGLPAAAYMTAAGAHLNPYLAAASTGNPYLAAAANIQVSYHPGGGLARWGMTPTAHLGRELVLGHHGGGKIDHSDIRAK